MATNRFVCEVCHKGFQREQNLQLHRRGHNLPWKLKQKDPKEARRRVYLCPEPTCVHHNPSRALGDLTGIKKHYCHKHGEKTLKCGKCDKLYAVETDWKAHFKTCGTREYRCDCGELFSRKDTFAAHRSFCNMAPRPSMLRSQAPSSSSFFLGGGAPSPAQDFSEDGDYSQPQGGQGLSLLHGKSPFHGLMQIPEQQHQPGSSNNANGNLLNLGYFSGIGNDGGSAGGQDVRRLVIQDQFNGSGGGGNSDHGGVMASVGSHGHLISGGFPPLYNSSPSSGLPQNSATALLMKAAQLGSTSSAQNGPSALLRAAGFGAARSGQGTSRGAAGEATSSHAAHFHDLIMNSLAGGAAAGFGAMDDGNLSTRDFLGVGLGATKAPSSGLRIVGAPDPAQMK
ncbi:INDETERMINATE protein 7 [Panicum miliaceum]|uniref:INDETERMINATE protein 7 n=1 Tax=Panicum miliaceum TaxID=4540 RepID=A0A3L6T5I0_PANMI|nr:INDETERMINATE protein 7 [Panicum miliaceum]